MSWLLTLQIVQLKYNNKYKLSLEVHTLPERVKTNYE